MKKWEPVSVVVCCFMGHQEQERPCWQGHLRMRPDASSLKWWRVNSRSCLLEWVPNEFANYLPQQENVRKVASFLWIRLTHWAVD